MRGIPQKPTDSSHKGTVIRKVFSCLNVIMWYWRYLVPGRTEWSCHGTQAWGSIYDHCSGGWCLEVTRRQRAYLPENACFETGKGNGVSRQRQLRNLCLTYPTIVKFHTRVVCGCTGPYGLGCLQCVNPYGTCKFIMHASQLHGPRVTWQKSHDLTGESRAPFGAIRILFAENCPRNSLNAGPGCVIWLGMSLQHQNK